MKRLQESLLRAPFLKKSLPLNTSVSLFECYVCGKGLQDGCCITAKTLTNGIALFCDSHYSLQ